MQVSVSLLFPPGSLPWFTGWAMASGFWSHSPVLSPLEHVLHCVITVHRLLDCEPQEDKDHVWPCLFTTVSLTAASVPGL